MMKRILFILQLILSLSHFGLNAQNVFPVAKDASYDGNRTVNFSKSVAVEDVRGCFADDLDFLKSSGKGLKVFVDFGAAYSGQYGFEAVSGAYFLQVSTKAVTLAGYDEKGAFYAIQTLRQLVEDAGVSRKVRCCTIRDWPEDCGPRGLVEAFEGNPWPHDYRLAMIEQMSSLKMDTYVYAPKGDPYVHTPDWIMPYPQAKADEIKEMMEVCRRNRVEFVWAVRPDHDFQWEESSYRLLIGKFEMMYYLGVRSFALFFDGVPQVNESEKETLLKRIDTDFISKRRGAAPLMTDLSGCYVPSYGGEALKMSVYGAAAGSWGKADGGFKALKTAASCVMPDASDAVTTFLKHASAFNKTFMISESEGLELVTPDDYSQERYDSLMAEFVRMEAVPEVIAESSNTRLVAELEPWLEEFGKLGTRGRKVLECLKYCREGDIALFWSTYAGNLMSEEDKMSYSAHPSGGQVLQPYYEDMMSLLADSFDARYKGRVRGEHHVEGGTDVFIAPEEASGCHLVLNNPEGEEVIVRLSDSMSRYVAEFCINESYFEFELKEDAVKVEILGRVPVFDVIFIK